MRCGDNGIGPEEIVQLLQFRGYHTVWEDVMERFVHSLPLHLPFDYQRRNIQVREYRKGLPCAMFEVVVLFETPEWAWIEHKLYGMSYSALYARLPALELHCADVVVRYGKKRSDPD